MLWQNISKKEDKIYKTKKVLHTIFYSFLQTAKRYTDVSQYGTNKIDHKAITFGALLDLGIKTMESVNPAIKARKKIKSKIEEAVIILEKAKANAEKHKSKEALAYVAELGESLNIIFNRLDNLESISEALKRIS